MAVVSSEISCIGKAFTTRKAMPFAWNSEPKASAYAFCAACFYCPTRRIEK
jgi:hypothetical protein